MMAVVVQGHLLLLLLLGKLARLGLTLAPGCLGLLLLACALRRGEQTSRGVRLMSGLGLVVEVDERFGRGLRVGRVRGQLGG